MTDPRTERLKNVFAKGHASLTDIWRADYGVWPPKGIDPIVEPKDEVEMLSPWKFGDHVQLEHAWRMTLEKKYGDPDYVPFTRAVEMMTRIPIAFIRLYIVAKTAGFVTKPDVDPRRRIYLRKAYARSLGHEATHIAQKDHVEESLLDLNPEYISSLIVRDFWDANKREAGPEMLLLWSEKEGELYEKPDFDADNGPSSMFYYKRGAEIQARIHECLAIGHPKWGRLPQTKMEFWAAMVAVGVAPPDNITKKLSETDEGKAAIDTFTPLHDRSRMGMAAQASSTFAGLGALGIGVLFGAQKATEMPFFSWGAPIALFSTAALIVCAVISPVVAAQKDFLGLFQGDEINVAQALIKTPEGHEAFWNDILPRLYADLLEMYGDGPGRARMGYGTNEKLTSSWFELFRKKGSPYGAEDWARWANALNEDQCVDVLERLQIVKTFRSRIGIKDRPNDAGIAAAILSRPDRDSLRHRMDTRLLLHATAG